MFLESMNELVLFTEGLRHNNLRTDAENLRIRGIKDGDLNKEIGLCSISSNQRDPDRSQLIRVVSS